MKPTAFTLRNGNLINALITSVRVNYAHTREERQDLSSYLECEALWDTGAASSVISTRVAAELNLQPTTRSLSYHAQGASVVNVYSMDMLLPNGILVQNIRVSEGVLNGFDVLIGMDIINLGDFALTHRDGKTVFSFQIPSTHEYDFVKQISNQGITPKPKKRQ